MGGFCAGNSSIKANYPVNVSGCLTITTKGKHNVKNYEEVDVKIEKEETKLTTPIGLWELAIEQEIVTMDIQKTMIVMSATEDGQNITADFTYEIETLDENIEIDPSIEEYLREQEIKREDIIILACYSSSNSASPDIYLYYIKSTDTLYFSEIIEEAKATRIDIIDKYDTIPLWHLEGTWHLITDPSIKCTFDTTNKKVDMQLKFLGDTFEFYGDLIISGYDILVSITEDNKTEIIPLFKYNNLTGQLMCITTTSPVEYVKED